MSRSRATILHLLWILLVALGASAVVIGCNQDPELGNMEPGDGDGDGDNGDGDAGAGAGCPDGGPDAGDAGCGPDAVDAAVDAALDASENEQRQPD